MYLLNCLQSLDSVGVSNKAVTEGVFNTLRLPSCGDVLLYFRALTGHVTSLWPS